MGLLDKMIRIAGRFVDENGIGRARAIKTDAEGSIITGKKVEEFISNQREIINILNSDKLIFGAYWDKSSNPQMIRTDAAVGLVAEAGVDGQLVRNDFDRMPIWGEIKEVMDEYGSYFMRIPKFYIRKLSGPDFYLVQVSKTRYPGFYLPWVFWDFKNNRELDYYDHAKYKASLSEDGTRLESKPDRFPLVNRTIVNFRNLARANNDEENGLAGYQLLDIHAQDVITTLFRIEFATMDSQSIMRGYTSGRYTTSDVVTIGETETNRVIVANSTANYYRVGQAISCGSSLGSTSRFYGREIIEIAPYDEENTAIYFDGDPVDILEGDILFNSGWKNGFSRNVLASSGCVVANDGKYPCVYRGIESPWGDVWQWVDGININDFQPWVCADAEEYASNVFAMPYEKLGYVNTDQEGYIKEMGFDPTYPFAELPVQVGASSSTYYSDYYYRAEGQRVARVGGTWNNGAVAGVSYWGPVSSSSDAAVNIGARLLKKAL